MPLQEAIFPDQATLGGTTPLFDRCSFTVPQDALEVPSTLQIVYGDRLQARGIDPVEWRPARENSLIYSPTYSILLKYLIAGHVADEHVSPTPGVRSTPVTRGCVADYIGSVLGNHDEYARFAELPCTFDKTSGMFAVDRGVLKDISGIEPSEEVTVKGQLFALRHAYFRIQHLILARKV